VDIRIFAVHLDDRNETLRESQVEALLPLLKETGLPTAVVGDFNAMWPKGRAQLLRSSVMRLIAKCIPHTGLRYTAVRLTEMAAGRVLGRFAEVGLRDADPRHRSTTTPKMRDTLFLPSIRLVQIDHILVSEEVEVNGFKISADHGSDHRSIRTTITTK
jgi:endonuclease/exonuclease/phosphatase family metal-dependent hydrolase